MGKRSKLSRDDYPVCNADNCKNKSKHYTLYNSKYGYYCKRHYSQIKEMGKIYEKTKFDKHDYTVINDYAEVYVNDVEHNNKISFLVDLSDLEMVLRYKWHITTNGYVNTRIKENGVSANLVLHKYVMGYDFLDEDVMIDHRDRVKTNCRKANLRVCDKVTNGYNTKISSNNKSGVKGVFATKNNSYMSYIANDTSIGGRISKKFKLFDEAVKHRIILEAMYAKEFSSNYNPQTQTIQLTYLSHDDNIQTYVECDLSGNIIQFKKL